MLTADLVRPRRKGGELVVEPLAPARRARALELASAVLDLVRAHVGAPRADLDEALASVDHRASERVLLLGLKKLVDDACTWDAEPSISPEELREDVFLASSAARARASREAPFSREAVLDDVARRRGVPRDHVEALLYADLRSAHVLREAPPFSPEALVQAWEDAQVQAVLLRAARITVDVRCRDAAGYRALFSRLKLHQLLFTIEARDDGYRLEVDGPLSLFSASTRYGLRLALLLPVLRACERFALVADVRWGKERAPYAFRASGGRGEALEEAVVPDEVRGLVEELRAKSTRFSVESEPAILDLPGLGVCVPDLALVDRETGEVVYVELLGHWSREAVWRRVELVERGLPARVLFCASERLRVSEAALDPDASSALYVYKGVPSARRILEKAAALARSAQTTS